MYLLASNLALPLRSVTGVFGAFLQGSSREEPRRAFALRSWRWSIKSKTKSCGSQPARCRGTLCCEMTGLPASVHTWLSSSVTVCKHGGKDPPARTPKAPLLRQRAADGWDRAQLSRLSSSHVCFKTKQKTQKTLVERFNTSLYLAS